MIHSSPNCNQFLKESKISPYKKNSLKFPKQETKGKDLHKHLYGGKDITPTKMHLANITANKFRSEKFMRSFYQEETKNDNKRIDTNKDYSNSNDRTKRIIERNCYINNNNNLIDEKFDKKTNNNLEGNKHKNWEKNNNQQNLNNLINKKFEEDQESEISVIKKYEKIEKKNFECIKKTSDKEEIKDEFDYENVDKPIDDKLKELDGNQKVLNTIKLISQNKKNFKETNKILKEIGNFYKDKKHILANFPEDDNENESDEKLKNYLKEYQKVGNDNQKMNNRIEKLLSKGSLHDKISRIHNEIKKSQNSLMKGKIIY